MDGWTKRDGVGYATGDALPVGSSWERRSPTRTAELVGDVAVPMLQAAITGLVGAAIGGWIGASVGAGLTSGAVVFGLAWLVLLVDHRRALWLVERVTGADLDGDSVVGPPDPVHPPATVRVELAERHPGGQRLRWIDLPVSDAKLRDVAQAVKVGASFSRDGLSSVLTQAEYRKLAGAMVEAGLLHDLPGNRRQLSAAGRVMMVKALDV